MTYKKSAATRDVILKVASRLFTEKGYYNTSLGDIAGEAGIGRASIYYHFSNKEHIARAIFDSIVGQFRELSIQVAGGDDNLLLRSLIEYILLFKHIALNKATQAVYFDLVYFAEYDLANIERLKDTFYPDAQKLANAYNVELSDNQLFASIITSSAFSKAMFKGILNGTLQFSLEEAMDSFCRHNLLCDIPIPEAEYQRVLAEAFKICRNINIIK